MRLWLSLTLRRRAQLATLLLLMSLVSLAEVVSIGAVLPFLGALTSPGWVFSHPWAQGLIRIAGFTSAEELLLPLTLVFIFAVLLSCAMRLALSWGQTRLCYAVGADISINIYRRTLYQPYDVHLTRNSSEVISAIASKADGVVYSTLLPSLLIISSAMMLCATFVMLVALEPIIAFAVIMGFGPIYGLTIVFTKYRLASYGHTISREQSSLVKALQEALGGIRDVLIDGTQAIYCAIYQSADRRLRRAQSNIVIISNSPRYVVEALGMMVISTLAYVLASRSQGVGQAIPILGALALGAQRMLPVLQQGYSSLSTLRSGRSSLIDTLELLNQPLPVYADLPAPAPMPFHRQIQLDHVTFRYADNQPFVLNKLSLIIPKGSCVGFIGSTGGGKSTLLDIIMGLLSPVKGGLLIDGVQITPQNYRAWQAHIAHVPQSIFLADATIAENIAFGVQVDQIDHERMRIAARRAQIDSTIETWPKKYDTEVGERGVRLSGGQRQRIGIARALYKNVDVIIFDEATSALDGDTESAVMQALTEVDKGVTMIIVAHRLTTLRNCTQVVEIAGGAIKRAGSFSEITGLSEKKDLKY
jgi:ABC-type multidrug transport system fused ATPase/permease subunit